jgi:capsular exopolysaccharide synthesis family protein
LLIGADIRKPKILEYIKSSSGKGLTHYLMDHNVSVSDVIEPVADYGFDMVHSGVIPPNPSELLMTNRFNDLLTYGKEHYDFVIVDNSPVNLVTDTLLIADYADLFIYVIRANFLDKRLLEVPKLMYDEKRLPNMAVLINDTNTDKGYGYGYGYGYGEQVVKKKWWQVFSK